MVEVCRDDGGTASLSVVSVAVAPGAPGLRDHRCAAVLTCSLGTGPDAEMVVVVVGEIDLCSIEVLTGVLSAVLDEPRRPCVIVDLRRAAFFAASAITELLRFQDGVEARGGRLVVVADSRPVLRPLELTGADELLEVRATYPGERVRERALRLTP